MSGMLSRLLALAAAVAALAAGPARAQDGPAQMTDEMRRMITEGARGSLAVQVEQGTEGGPGVGAARLSIELYHQNMAVYQMTRTLEENGTALLGDLPVGLAVRPVVRIEYDGVSYVELGPSMDAEHPDAAVKLTVYQTTHEAPAWRVAMRHIMVQRVTDGTIVNETLVVENPTDKTWFGGEPMREEKGTTVRVGLPALVTQQDVHLDSGFHGWCCTTFENGELTVQMPMMPGQTPYKYTYFIPTQPEQVDLTFSAIAPTDSIVVFVPDDGTETEATTLAAQGTQDTGRQRMRTFTAEHVNAGQRAGVVLRTLRTAAEVQAPTASVATPFPWVMAAGLAGAVVLAILVVVMMRGRG
jgi:hypothetical protein